MPRFPTDAFMISLLALNSTLLGCGIMPAGQSSTRTFTVPRIARDKGGARAFVQRLVMQTVFDVFERQGRSALLPDAVILAILDQLTVNITYEPLECMSVGSGSMIMGANERLMCFSRHYRD
ncbi:hypothetical protein KIN20_020091 [Parelaphostrongylus tenuis]|uniref:Uncharacterized protein n=1 Tax=Parelaphostrongylus tenuis TaxID=148309 RepID=A0AAD5QVD8_PARTN|nr:hypothetical protein KIN20_020091 [Parelaphostrongylus tenuis]